MSKSITVHTLVQNEEKYIWFSVMSVIDYVDKVFIWDTGSSDNTIKIIKEIQKEYPDKVYFKQVGKVDPDQFTSIRQQMLNETKTDWLILVDGDEVWWDETIKEVVGIINDRGDSFDTIVNKYANLIGDIFHFQDESAGKYNIDGQSGFLTIRAMNRKLPGLNVGKPHGQQGFFDKDGLLIQNRDEKKRFHLNKVTNLHFTNLPRSKKAFDIKVPKRAMKYKYELGNSFPFDYYYPEVFFRSKPKVVDDPWQVRSVGYELRALVETPLKLLKRKLIPSRKSGY